MEPSQEAQDEWVRIIRETSITDRKFWRECTPGYYNNEGEEVFRSHLGEPYGPGFYAFDRLLKEWRDKGDMEGPRPRDIVYGGGAALPVRSSKGEISGSFTQWPSNRNITTRAE